MRRPLLSVRLTAAYSKVEVLRDFALELHEREILSLVGESGCGKSTLALTILRLLGLRGGRASGSILLNGVELMDKTEREMRQIRGRDVGLVLQSPMTSLNPALRIGTQLYESWRAHERGSRSDSQLAIRNALESVSLPADMGFLQRLPSQLSVGQAQRVLIAIAIMHKPSLVIADEPTSALDILTQAEILGLFGNLRRTYGTSILYISHDLLSVATISDRVAVMQAGQAVECRPTADIFRNPQHPYTRELVGALPGMPQFGVATANT